MTIKRKSRRDLDAIGNPNYVPMKDWDLDAIHGALKPLDAKAAEIELRWGTGRLETLVSPETAAKFESARAKLDVALNDRAVDLVIQRAGVMMRGYDALEREAMEAGHKPAPPEVWHATAPAENGEKEMQIVIVKDNFAASLEQSDVPCYTVTEVARMVRAFKGQHLIHAAKTAFPGAEIVRIGDENFEDELPF